MDENKKTVLETAIERELENGKQLEAGKDLTQSNKVLAELCKVEVEADKVAAEAEVEKARIEAEERKAKRDTTQRYVNTACMVGLGFLALFADSDSFIGRVNSKVMGYAAKIIFKG